jgi:hypothetical protein
MELPACVPAVCSQSAVATLGPAIADSEELAGESAAREDRVADAIP